MCATSEVATRRATASSRRVSADAVTVALVVPAFNEATLGLMLARAVGCGAQELIAVHTGDAITLQSLRDNPPPSGVRVLESERGRARQMNVGASVARADVILFLHADTALPSDALDAVRQAIAAGALWGFFRVRLAGRHPLLRIVERLMNWRSRLTAIATGDQAIFVRRDVFRVLGGFAPIELMEDIELCARLKTFGRPTCLASTVVTSSRRWETRGVLRTIVQMWMLRALYALGVSPRRLARWYR